MGPSLGQRTQLSVGTAEPAMSVGLRAPVAEFLGRPQRVLLRDGQVVVAAAVVEVVDQHLGQLPGVCRESVLTGGGDRGEQRRMLSGEPGSGLGRVGRRFGVDPGTRRLNGERIPVRVERPYPWHHSTSSVDGPPCGSTPRPTSALATCAVCHAKGRDRRNHADRLTCLHIMSRWEVRPGRPGCRRGWGSPAEVPAGPAGTR